MSANKAQDGCTVSSDHVSDSLDSDCVSPKVSSDPSSIASDSTTPCSSPKSQEGGESIFSFMMERKSDKRSFRARYNSFLKELNQKHGVEVVTPTLRWRVTNQRNSSSVYIAKVVYHPLMQARVSCFGSGVSQKRQLVCAPAVHQCNKRVVSQVLPVSVSVQKSH